MKNCKECGATFPAAKKTCFRCEGVKAQLAATKAAGSKKCSACRRKMPVTCADCPNCLAKAKAAAAKLAAKGRKVCPGCGEEMDLKARICADCEEGARCD